MRTSWPDAARGLVPAWIAALAFAAAAPALHAQQPGTQEEKLDRLDRQIDDAEADTAGVEGARPNTELWEEYQRYRDPDDLRHSNERVEVGGSITIGEDELIEGDVVAVGGTVTVHGKVEGDCVAIGGDVILHDGAVIEGDAVAVGGKVRSTGDAEVMGERVSIDIGLNVGDWFRGWGSGSDHDWSFEPPRGVTFVLRLVKLLGVLLVVSLVYAVAGRRMEIVARRIDEEPGQSFLIGLLAVCATPFAFVVVSILLAITLIGILLIPVLAALVAALGVAGVAAAALAVGRRVLAARSGDGGLAPTGSPYRSLAVGVLALYAVKIVGWVLDVGWTFLDPVALLFNVLGAFVLAFASILGYGALMTSRFGTLPVGAMPGGAIPPRPPVPPPPPPPPTPAPAPPRAPAPDAPPPGAAAPPREPPPPRDDDEKPSA
jgi:hypothetical protein